MDMPAGAVSQHIEPRAAFFDLNLSTWNQMDKTDLLLPAPAAICVLADLLLSATSAEFPLSVPQSGSFTYITRGNSFKATVIQLVQDSSMAFNQSYKRMIVELDQGCRSVLSLTQTVLELLAKLDEHPPNKLYLDAITRALTKLETVVGKGASAARTVQARFDDLIGLVTEMHECLDAARSKTVSTKKSLDNKMAVLEQRKMAAKEAEQMSAAHLAETKRVFDRDRVRFEKFAAEFPSGSEVASMNYAQILMESSSIEASLLMSIYGKNPMGLVDTWKMLKNMYEPDGDDTPLRQSGESLEALRARLNKLTPSGSSVLVQQYSAQLLGLLTSGPEGGVDWDSVNTVVPLVQAALTVDLELLRTDAFDQEDHAFEQSNEAFGTEVTQANGSPSTISKTCVPAPTPGNVCQPSAPIPPAQVISGANEIDLEAELKSMLEECIQLCKDLIHLVIPRDAERTAKVSEGIRKLNRRALRMAFKAVLASHTAPEGPETVIAPVTEVTSTEKSKMKTFSGDRLLEQAKFKLVVSREQLDTSRVIFEAAMKTAYKARDSLDKLVTHLAVADFRKRNVNAFLRSMAIPVAFMGQVHTAFSSINCLFSALYNLVNVTMTDAFEKFKTTTMISTVSVGGVRLGTFEKKRISRQVVHAAKVACMTQEFAKLYIKMFESSAAVGIDKVLKMQELTVKDATKDASLIEKYRREIVGWAAGTQQTVDTMLKGEQQRFLKMMDKRTGEIASAALPHRINEPELSKTLEEAKNNHVSSTKDRLSAWFDWEKLVTDQGV